MKQRQDVSVDMKRVKFWVRPRQYSFYYSNSAKKHPLIIIAPTGNFYYKLLNFKSTIFINPIDPTEFRHNVPVLARAA